jgi:hypothetical protein
MHTYMHACIVHSVVVWVSEPINVIVKFTSSSSFFLVSVCMCAYVHMCVLERERDDDDADKVSIVFVIEGYVYICIQDTSVQALHKTTQSQRVMCIITAFLLFYYCCVHYLLQYMDGFMFLITLCCNI